MGKKTKILLRIVGKTDDGKTVLAGVYETYATYGLPLEELLYGLVSNNAVPDWFCFVDEALAAGMKRERAISMLYEPLTDVYGPEFRDVILERMKNEPFI